MFCKTSNYCFEISIDCCIYIYIFLYVLFKSRHIYTLVISISNYYYYYLFFQAFFLITFFITSFFFLSFPRSHQFLPLLRGAYLVHCLLHFTRPGLSCYKSSGFFFLILGCCDEETPAHSIYSIVYQLSQYL